MSEIQNPAISTLLHPAAVAKLLMASTGTLTVWQCEKCYPLRQFRKALTARCI
jgi:hypothetical protein